MTTTATHPIAVGAVVTYHGSLADQHFATYYIQAIGNGLTIVDTHCPWFALQRVHPSSVTPTGERLTLCACGHDVELRVNGYCQVVPCGCDDHGWNVR